MFRTPVNRKSALIAAVVPVVLALCGAPHAAADTSPLQPLVDAAAQRLQTADPVAAVKLRTGGQIEDPQREQQVIDAVTADASAQHIDPAYVHDAFRNQIDATVAVEHSLIGQWKLDPATAPAAASDLASLRKTIDELNHTMVGEMARQWSTLHSPSCPQDLTDAVDTVAGARHLDPLYRRALDFATQTYCR